MAFAPHQSAEAGMAELATPKLILAAMALGLLAAMASCTDDMAGAEAIPPDATGIAVEPEPRPAPATP
jgi:hypothetical protein